MDQDFYRDLNNYEASTQGTGGDFIDGIVVALDMIDRHCGTKKYKKRVFLITDGEYQTKTTSEEVESLIGRLKDKDIRLNVISLDFGNELGIDEDDEEEVVQA